MVLLDRLGVLFDVVHLQGLIPIGRHQSMANAFAMSSNNAGCVAGSDMVLGGLLIIFLFRDLA